MTKFFLGTGAYALALANLCWAASETEVSASLGAATELARKVVDLGTHKLTYIRITAPMLPRTPVAPPPAPRILTAEEQAAEDARAEKTHVQLFLSVTVYPGSGDVPTVTDLNWWKEGKRYQAWANVDFRVFSSFTELETETHVYSWFPGVGEGSIEGIPASERPAGFSLFSAFDAPCCYVEGDADDLAAESDILTGLDYFCAYYELHRERLASDYLKRKADEAAREAELKKNPPKPVSTVIHFWKNPQPANP